jgi:hypothetical protein
MEGRGFGVPESMLYRLGLSTGLIVTIKSVSQWTCGFLSFPRGSRRERHHPWIARVFTVIIGSVTRVLLLMAPCCPPMADNVQHFQSGSYVEQLLVQCSVFSEPRVPSPVRSSQQCRTKSPTAAGLR